MQKLSIHVSCRRFVISLAIIILLAFMIQSIVISTHRWIAVALINNQASFFSHASNEILAGKDVSLLAFELISDQEIWQNGITVAYYTGSYALVTSSVSFGFIYSTDGNPHPIPDMIDYPCTKTAQRVRWQQPNGDNFCELIPITDNFFHFKIGY